MRISLVNAALLWVAALVCGIPWRVQAAPAPLPELTLHAEVRLPVEGASKAYHFVPATTLSEGQEVFYTLRIHNPTDQPLSEVEVVQAIPPNTRYVAGSASGAGAKISFSTDRGRSFASAEALQASGDSAPYTHIRWQLPYVLAPNAVLLARFRAVFD